MADPASAVAFLPEKDRVLGLGNRVPATWKHGHPSDSQCSLEENPGADRRWKDGG